MSSRRQRLNLFDCDGVVNILAEGSIFAKNPNSTTEYWGIYADGHATFANGNVKFMANGSAEYAGKITSTSGKIGGWSLSIPFSASYAIWGKRKFSGIGCKTALCKIWGFAPCPNCLMVKIPPGNHIGCSKLKHLFTCGPSCKTKIRCRGFGWKMYSGRFSAPHAALVSDSYNNGFYVSSADLSEIA